MTSPGILWKRIRDVFLSRREAPVTVYLVEVRAAFADRRSYGPWLTVSRPCTRERAVADAEAVEALGGLRARIREEAL